MHCTSVLGTDAKNLEVTLAVSVMLALKEKLTTIGTEQLCQNSGKHKNKLVVPTPSIALKES